MISLNPLDWPEDAWKWATSRWDSMWEKVQPIVSLFKVTTAAFVGVGLLLPAAIDTAITALNVAITSIPSGSIGPWYATANAIVPLYEIGQLLMAIIALKIAAVAVKIIRFALSFIF